MRITEVTIKFMADSSDISIKKLDRTICRGLDRKWISVDGDGMLPSEIRIANQIQDIIENYNGGR